MAAPKNSCTAVWVEDLSHGRMFLISFPPSEPGTFPMAQIFQPDSVQEFFGAAIKVQVIFRPHEAVSFVGNRRANVTLPSFLRMVSTSF